MKKQPNPIRHMMTWGVVSGTLFTGLFLAYTSGDGGGGSPLNIVTYYANFLAALGYGSLMGAVIGFAGGDILRRRLADITMPFTDEDREKHEQSIYLILSATSLILTVLAFFLYGKFNILLFIPAIIHVLVSVISARHYMGRLQKWSKQFDQRKSKAKHEDYDMNLLLDESDHYPVIEAADSDASGQSSLKS